MNSISKKLTALFIILCLSVSLFACNVSNTGNSGNNSGTQDNGSQNKDENKTSNAAAFVTLDINPSIEITVKKDGTVASVYGANEDGQILLYGEADNIVDKNYEQAIKYITELAVKFKYLTEETVSVNTAVIADNEQFAKEIEEKIVSGIKAKAEETKITVEVDTTAPFSLLCELEALKEKYPDNVKIQSLTPSEYKLALALSEREDISIVAAVEYDSEEIIERISAAHNTLETYATDAYLLAKAKAIVIFDNAMGVITDGVYSEIYLTSLMSHLNTYYYGYIYQGYKTLARTYASIYEIKTFADEMATFELDEETVNSIATELGIEDVSVLKDVDGKVTLESLIAFSDEFVKNENVSEDIKAKVEEIIADAKNAKELADKGTTESYKSDIEALKTQISATVTALKATYDTTKAFMSAEAQANLDACLNDLASAEAKIAAIIEGGIAYSEVEALAEEANTKADEWLEKIKADLSEDELAAAEAKLAKLEEMRDTLTEEFEARLSTAEAEAKNYIEAQREARKNAK